MDSTLMNSTITITSFPSDSSIFALVISIFSILLSTLFTYFYSKIYKKPPGRPLEQRIDSLTAALKESVKLIDTMQREIESKQQLADKLQKDNEIADNLIKLKRPEVEAITQTFRTEINAQEKKSFIRNIAINAGFFIAGAIVSVITTLLLK